ADGFANGFRLPVVLSFPPAWMPGRCALPPAGPGRSKKGEGKVGNVVGNAIECLGRQLQFWPQPNYDATRMWIMNYLSDDAVGAEPGLFVVAGQVEDSADNVAQPVVNWQNRLVDDAQ